MSKLHFIRIMLAGAQVINWREAQLEAEGLVGKGAVIQAINDDSLD